MVVPQPAMRRYCAMVVEKPPELEKIAIEPWRSESPGLSPPSAPPMRTWFHESATPRPLAPKMSMPFCWPMRADLARIVHRDLLGDDEDLAQLGVDADQLGHAVARAPRAAGRRRRS